MDDLFHDVTHDVISCSQAILLAVSHYRNHFAETLSASMRFDGIIERSKVLFTINTRTFKEFVFWQNCLHLGETKEKIFVLHFFPKTSIYQY